MGAPGYDVAVQHLLSEAAKVKALARDRTDLDIEARPLSREACVPAQPWAPRAPATAPPSVSQAPALGSCTWGTHMQDKVVAGEGLLATQCDAQCDVQPQTVN